MQPDFRVNNSKYWLCVVFLYVNSVMLDVIARPNKLCLVDLQWTRAVEYYQSADDDGDEKHHFRRRHVPSSSRYSYYACVACDHVTSRCVLGVYYSYRDALHDGKESDEYSASIRPRRSRAKRPYPSPNATVYYSGEICSANAFQSVMIKAARDRHS